MRRLTTLSLVPLVLAAGLLGACQAPEADAAREDAAQSATDHTTEAEHRARAEAVWAEFEAAAREGDVGRVVAPFAEDTWIRGVGPAFESVRGREAYAEAFGGMLPALAVESLDVEVEDVIVLGDHVFEAGTFTEAIRVRETDEMIEIRGSYSGLWKQVDGEWRIHRFMWSEQPNQEP